jgi:hypothetical protein
MTAFVIFVLLVLVLLIWVVRRLYRRDDKLDPVVQGVQAILTAFAILLAGTWYLVERKGMSHAELALKGNGVRLPGGMVLVQLRIEIRNIGHTLLRARDWDIRLQSIYPTDLPVAPLAATDLNHWPAAVGEHPAYHTQEIRWPAISRFRGQDLHEVEPGETDLKSVDFFVPCASEKVVRASAAVLKLDPRLDWPSIAKRLRGEAPDQLWWKERALFDLGKLCAAPEGSTMELGIGLNGDEQEEEKE